MFIVEIDIAKWNVINIYIDSMDGVTINQCAALSRFVESGLDRETEDFELVVSSAGLSRPFKVIQQYFKHIGKEVELVLTDGTKLEGILREADENRVLIETNRKEKIQGEKKKQLVREKHSIEFENIKTAKSVIKFK